MDPAGIPALRDAIRHMHGLEAEWLETAHVHEKMGGATVWQGDVEMFSVSHPKVDRVYAWSEATEGDRRRFFAVLQAGPVASPEDAVRASILADAKK